SPNSKITTQTTNDCIATQTPYSPFPSALTKSGSIRNWSKNEASFSTDDNPMFRTKIERIILKASLASVTTPAIDFTNTAIRDPADTLGYRYRR
ncbi:MAG: hypothetical protein ACKOAH_25110, partial [Pirellula sp.]